ncbi:MAG: adenylyltransferase/cytidyltransferase family protein [Alphaproteobacteria bacterium]|nr:adenylyltransferase/cytidyltransferase family protein [Alphaproteobacteria bacterium]
MSDFKYKHGLVVMRAQPFHIGHQKLVDRMLTECERVTVILGSIQEQGTDRNPLNYTTRKKMIQNIYRDKLEYERLKIIGLFDINNPAEWGKFVLDFIKESFPDLPTPDVYYAGSSYDAHWFKACVPHIELVDRTDQNFPFVSGTMVRDMIRYGDIRWKNFINPTNHHIIEEHFNKKKGII